MIITHPVVGKIFMRQALTRDRIAPMPLDICVAHSQGGIAYLLVQALESALRRAGNERHGVPAYPGRGRRRGPGVRTADQTDRPFFSAADAAAVQAELGWLMKPDGARRRHVVPSPEPLHICDISLVEELAQRGTAVIAGGGGGIPVVRAPDCGVEAVIDKDRTSVANLGIETLLILTAGVSGFRRA